MIMLLEKMNDFLFKNKIYQKEKKHVKSMFILEKNNLELNGV